MEGEGVGHGERGVGVGAEDLVTAGVLVSFDMKEAGDGGVGEDVVGGWGGWDEGAAVVGVGDIGGGSGE